MSEVPLIGLAVAVWIVGIPVALGFFLRGRWPKTEDEFWKTPIVSWLEGIFWPLALLIIFVKLALQGLWFLGISIAQGLFWFGGWLNHFLPGPPR